MFTLASKSWFRLYLSGVLLLGTVWLQGAVSLRGGFAAGGRSVGDGLSVVGVFSKGQRSAVVATAYGLETGASSAWDYAHQGPGSIVLANPNGPSGWGGLTEGEVFFHAGLSAFASGGDGALYERLPRVTDGPLGLMFSYKRSGAAALSMNWTYEISQDLVNWSAYVPVAEEVLYDAALNLSHIRFQLPQQSPLFVRIQLDYNE